MTRSLFAPGIALCLSLASCNLLEEPSPRPEEAEPAIEAGSQRISVPKDFGGRSEAEFQKLRLAWILRNNLDGFILTGLQDAAWADEAKAFIEKSCLSYCLQVGAPGSGDLEKAGLALMGKSCDDPFVHLWLGVAMLKNGKPKEAMPHLRRAASRFQRGDFPKLALALAADRLSKSLEGESSGDGKLLRGASLNVAASAMAEAASDVKDYAPPRPDFIFREALTLHASQSPLFWEKAAKAAKGAGGPPWLAKMLEAEAVFDAACREGGAQRGATPSKELAEKLKPGSEKAAAIASAAWGEAMDAPEAPAFIIELLSMSPDAATGADAATWLARAVEAQPDWLPAYIEYMDWLAATSPDPERAILKFGASCLDTGRFDTDVPRVCLAAIFKVASERADFGWRAAFSMPEVSGMIDRLYAGLLAQPLQDGERSRLVLEHAILMSWCGRSEEARSEFNKVPAPEMDFQSIFPDMRIPWGRPSKLEFESELRAFTGACRDRLVQWQALKASGDKAATKAALAKLLRVCATDKGVRKLVREQEALSMLGLPAASVPQEALDDPFSYSLQNSRSDIAKFLIDNGAELKARRKEGAPDCLLLALTGGQPEEIVQLLVMKGTVLDGKTPEGATPLHLALRKKMPAASALLVEMGVDLDAKDAEGLTPLHLAVLGNYPELVRLMLKRHAKAETPDSGGNTALHLAAKAGSREIVEAILEHGGKFDLKNSEGRTAADIAYQAGNSELASLIENAPQGHQKKKGRADD